MCGCEFNLAAAGGAIAGVVLGYFSSGAMLAPSTIVHCALYCVSVPSGDIFTNCLHTCHCCEQLFAIFT